MKYTKSQDGKMRVTIAVIRYRLTEEEVREAQEVARKQKMTVKALIERNLPDMADILDAENETLAE